jgi:anti-sigma regulatory factor (Ser/Thr protein kinase)
MRERAFETPHARDKGEVLGSVTLSRRADEVAVARRFVAKILGDRPETDTAVLLTSEAVTNSVVHTHGATITVAVLETPSGLRVEVTDGGADTVPTLYEGRDLREGKRGVFLLRHLSVRAGFHAGESGLTVWFEL